MRVSYRSTMRKTSIGRVPAMLIDVLLRSSRKHAITSKHLGDAFAIDDHGHDHGVRRVATQNPSLASALVYQLTLLHRHVARPRPARRPQALPPGGKKDL